MTAYVVATTVTDVGGCSRYRLGRCRRRLIGLVNGIGVGVFRVHPLIMTLGTSLVGTGA